jgi:hypothetical protein
MKTEETLRKRFGMGCGVSVAVPRLCGGVRVRGGSGEGRPGAGVVFLSQIIPRAPEMEAKVHAAMYQAIMQ